jgi:cyclophilin family peptidyl-prolyl cis-trans isomerase
MLKVILIVVLLAVVLVALTACGKNENKTNTDDTLSYINSRGDKNVVSNTTENLGSGTTSNATTFLKRVKALSSEEVLANAEKQMAEPEVGDTIAIFHIQDYGDVTVKLFEEEAPKACENFITHAKNGYYDGLTFHRVIDSFMIQGGDPKGNGTGGESIWGTGFEEELNETILPYRGSLCMASSGTGTSSLGSQFFITQANYSSLMTSYLSQYGISNLLEAYKKYGGDLTDLVGYAQYTTFGQVIEGLDIVDKIAAVSTNSSNKPIEDVIISNIEITTYTK